MNRYMNGGRRGIGRRTALKGLATGGVGSIVLGGRVTGTPGNGKGPRRGGCSVVVPDDYATIQGAVNAANEGDSICVRDGTYEEQVVIDTSLTIKAARGAAPTIRAPPAPKTFTFPESPGSIWEPVFFAYGGIESGGSITGTDTVSVSIEGLTVDGAARKHGPRAVGILNRNNRGGKVTGNTVRNMGVGGPETFGILAYGGSDLVIADNDVSGYERGGIGANGDGGAHPAPTVDVRGNTVTGSTGIGEKWGPNGIQVGFGAAGRVMRNTIVDNRYGATTEVASGILVFETDGVSVRDNVVENCDAALSVGSWGLFSRSANNTKFIENDVTGAIAGVVVEAISAQFSSHDAAVVNTKVANNDLAAGNLGDEAGVSVTTGNYAASYDPVVRNTKIIRNEITGFEEQVADDGSGTKLNANRP